MNIRKFLAIKIAEQAAEISNQAEHVADHHADNGPLVDECQEELLTSILTLGALAIVAQQNGLVPTVTRERAEDIKLEARRALMREAFVDMVGGKLVGELVI